MTGRKMDVSSKNRPRGTTRRALVTGASAGIGAAFAERLARDGWELCIVARRRQRLEEMARRLRREHGVDVEVVVADLTDRQALRRLESRIARDERLELLINNAGLADFGHFVDLDRDVQESEIRLDIIAVVRLTHAVLPGMLKRRRGSIVNVSSLAALTPGPNYAVYAACKSFLNTFTEALHFELAGTGVRLQVLCPGLTRTEIFAAAHADASTLPSFLWMEPAAVVDESLAALERGTLVCVPGLANQTLSSLNRLVPKEVAGRVANFFSERAIMTEAVKTPRRQRARKKPA
jgi:short-subunit dehydrogenase